MCGATKTVGKFSCFVWDDARKTNTRSGGGGERMRERNKRRRREESKYSRTQRCGKSRLPANASFAGNRNLLLLSVIDIVTVEAGLKKNQQIWYLN